jgi:hypothetical protein
MVSSEFSYGEWGKIMATIANGSATGSRYIVDTDAAGRWFGVWDTLTDTWVIWGVERSEAARTASVANRTA